MYFKPPQNNMTSPFYHPLNKQPMQEAVTVEMQFKTDADGAAAVGSETKSRGMLISGQKVKNKVYRLTFKNNNVMNQFMKTYDNKLDEGTEELEEGTAEYRAMMKKYKGSDMEKVFKILDKEGFRMGEQSDTLVRNMLKKHKGNVKKAADQIMKDNPGMFDVNRMMMDDVQIDEAKATAKNIVKGLSDSDGPFTVVAMKRDKVIKQESTKMRNMLPAIISEMRKEVGSGVTIAIEDRRGTIRNTFKEGVERVIDNLDDYLAEGSE